MTTNMKAGNPVRTYGFQIASDVNLRDGIGCEIWDLDADEIIAEVFRDDTTKQLTFTAYTKFEIPLAVLERMLQLFEEGPGRTFINYDSPEYNT